MSKTDLSPAQHAILASAIQNTGGKIEWFPDNIKGGARKKVLEGLFNRALITTDGTDWFAAAEGYDALGCPRPDGSGCRSGRCFWDGCAISDRARAECHGIRGTRRIRPLSFRPT